ncbi:hypothetical protein Hanom_Chr09g00794701 [Helianthus anomalus]
MLMQSPLAYALSAHIVVYLDILQQFWKEARLLIHDRSITFVGSWVLGKPITLTENVIREVLNLNDNNNALSFTREQIDNTLTQMGHNVENPNRPISMSGLLKPWQYPVTQLGYAFQRRL